MKSVTNFIKNARNNLKQKQLGRTEVIADMTTKPNVLCTWIMELTELDMDAVSSSSTWLWPASEPPPRVFCRARVFTTGT